MARVLCAKVEWWSLFLLLAIPAFAIQQPSPEADAKYKAQEKAFLDIYPFANGNYDPSYEIAKEMMKLAEPFGDKHVNFINSHYAMGLCEQEFNRLDEAQAHFEKGIKSAETIGDGALYAEGRSDLALVLEWKGEYAEAHRLYEESLKSFLAIVEEKEKDPKYDPEELSNHRMAVTNGYLNLGRTMLQEGEITSARKHLLKSLELAQKFPNPRAPVAIPGAYILLGVLHGDLGQYSESRKYFNLAKKLLAGSDAIEAGTMLSSFGYDLYHLGDFKESWATMQEGLKLFRKLLGDKDNRAVADLYSSMGSVLEFSGRPRSSIEYHQKAYDMFTRIGNGKPYRNSVNSASHLGKVYFDLGEYQKAEEKFVEVKRICDEFRAQKKNNIPDFECGRVLARLAALDFVLGRKGTPDRDPVLLYKEALVLLTKDVGPRHPLVTQIQNELGVALATQADRWSEAWKIFLGGGKAYLDWLSPILQTGTPREHHEILAKQRRGLDQLLSLAEQHHKGLSLPEKKELFGFELAFRGLSTRTLRGRYETALADRNPEAKALLNNKLIPMRQQLSHHLLYKNQKTSSAFLDGYERLEKEFAALTEAGESLELLSNAGPDELASHLAGDEVLIEVVRYRYLDPSKKVPGKALAWEKDNHYAAFILSKNTDVRFIPLGSASAIDKAARRFYHYLKKGELNPARENKAIVDLIWTKISQDVPPKGALRIVPDGDISLIPFEAIRVDPDKTNPEGYLVRPFRISYLSSGRDLLPRPQLPRASSPALIIAAPDFDAMPPVDAQATAVPANSETPLIPDTDTFDSLQGIVEEATVAQTYLSEPNRPATVLMGQDADEQILRERIKQDNLNHSSPSVVYWSTHGVYLNPNSVARAPYEIERGIVISEDTPQEETPIDALTPDTGIGKVRNFLAMAGANRRTERVRAGMNDGLLTSLELEGLDLTGTTLGVFSACDTGRGQRAVMGEDIYGLRLAVHLTGAKSSIGNLWPVADRQIKKIMESFLINWKVAGMPKAAALQKAKVDFIEKEAQSSLDGSSVPPKWWASPCLFDDPY